MSFEKFTWDKQKNTVSWIYNNKSIIKQYQYVNFANYNLKENYIIIKSGQLKNIEVVSYFLIDGKEFFSYDRLNNTIYLNIADRITNIYCKNLETAQIYIENKLVIIIENLHKNKIIYGFSLDGILLFEKKPPEGYWFCYLSKLNNLPSVVCDGGKYNSDSFGRSQFHFTINPINGDMIKSSIAY